MNLTIVYDENEDFSKRCARVRANNIIIRRETVENLNTFIFCNNKFIAAMIFDCLQAES